MLARNGDVLKSIFTEDDYIGRIGGDEFCVLVNSKPKDGKSFEDFIEEKCTMFNDLSR